jgi:hypothetical protein
MNIMFLSDFLILVSIFNSSDRLVPTKNSVFRLIDVLLLGITFRILIVVVKLIRLASAPPQVVP